MPAAIKLESISGDRTEEIIQIDSGYLTIGRDPENGIVVDSEAVSRRHGCVFEAGDFWVYTDTGSTNGSWVNDVAVKPDQIRLLRHGDILQIANLPMRVLELNPQDQTVQGSFGELTILLFHGEQFEQAVLLGPNRPKFIIGGPDADLDFDGGPKVPLDITVFRNTARVELNAGKADFPLLVNERVASGIVPLVDRDAISLSDWTLIICDPRTAKYNRPDQKHLPARTEQGRVPFANAPTPQTSLGKNTSDSWAPLPAVVSHQPSGHRPGMIQPYSQTGGEISTTRTQVMPGQRFNVGSTYDTHPAHRMAGGMRTMADDDNDSAREQFRVYLGVIVIVLVVTLVLVALFAF